MWDGITASALHRNRGAFVSNKVERLEAEQKVSKKRKKELHTTPLYGQLLLEEQNRVTYAGHPHSKLPDY